MAKSDAVLKLIEEDEKSTRELKSSIDQFTATLVDQNEELIATFVEGTKRLIKKEGKDLTPSIKSLESTTKSSLESVKKGVGEVERAIKSIKQADNSALILETRTSKNQLKKIGEKLDNFNIELPKKASDAIPVRLSDGKEFYNALENIATFGSRGGGGGEFAYKDSNGSGSHGLLDDNRNVIVSNQVATASILAERVSNTDGASTALSTFGATTGQRNMITTITVYNSSATAGFVDIRDGVAGSIIFTVPLPSGGGAVVPLPVPLRQPTSGTALAYDVSGALSTVYLSFIGYKSNL